MISCSDISRVFLSRIIFIWDKEKIDFKIYFSTKHSGFWNKPRVWKENIGFKMTQTLNADSFNQKIMGAAQAW